MGARTAVFFRSLSPTARALWFVVGFQVFAMIVRAFMSLG
jgi:hypothetical protein